MNTRSIQLLEKLLDERYHSISTLAKELSISDRLARYTLNDVESFLQKHKINGMEYDRNLGVRLNVDAQDKAAIEKIIYDLDSYEYTLGSDERKLYILLLVCTNREFITSQKIADKLNVSKSSIDKDILNLRRDLEKFGISIISKGSKGSYIKGNERDIRMYLYRSINRNIDFSYYIRNNPNSLNFIEKSIDELLFEDNLSHIREAIDISEQFSEMNLTYQSYKDICIHLAISIIRNKLGFKLEECAEQNYELEHTNGYVLSKILINQIEEKDICDFNEAEIIYLAIIINSARYTTMQGPVLNDWANVQIIATGLIRKVSEIIRVDLTNDDELLNALTLHLGPTIFKLKNNIPVVNPNLTVVKREYLDMFKAVEEALLYINVEELYGIDEDDISYMALHFCASLERHKRFKKEYNIIVVCVHSIATASLMKEIICTRFKNINVLKTITRDNLKCVNLEGVDFIVSSIDLDFCPIPYIKVNVVLKENDQLAIEELMEKLNCPQIAKEVNIVDEVMKIVESSATNNIEKIKEDLTYYFSRTGVLKPKVPSSLYDYLGVERVNIINSAENIEKAIQIVCQPLINSKDIDEKYILSILKTINDVGNYMVIEDGVALVHGEMGEGVYNDSMSLLMIENGVKFNHKKYDPVYMILCLATNSQKSLNKALSNFLVFLEEYEKNDRAKYFKKEYLLNQIKKASNYD